MALSVQSILDRLDWIKIAIETAQECGNHDRKLSGEKAMNGHYLKALQELHAVQKQLENLLERAKAQEADQ